MMVASRRHVRLRCAGLWCVVTAVAAGVVAVTLPTLCGAPGAASDRDFTGLLVATCSAASTLAAGWLWALTTEVAVRVLPAGGQREVVVRRQGATRVLLLAACGVVALGGPAAAAGPGHHDDRPGFAAQELAGLPLPDRATSEARPAARPHVAVHHVREGDSLWSIAEEHLGPRAAVDDLVAYWHRLYDRNAATIGADPDLILPGQALELPPPG